MNDADFTRTCNNLLYPPRRQPAPARPLRTVDDVRAEAYAIAEMLKATERREQRKRETQLREAEKRFGEALRAGLANEIPVEQFQAELRRYLRITGQEDFGRTDGTQV
jgi:hypothetical protein